MLLPGPRSESGTGSGVAFGGGWTMRDRIGFLSLLGLAFLVALFFSFGLAQVLGASGIKAPRTNLDVLELFQSRLAEVEATGGIAFLGDSTAMSGQGRQYTIPGRLGALLGEQAGGPPVVSLAEAGLGPMDFYLLASEVAEARPSAVVLSVNMAALSHVWTQRLSHPEFASVIGGERWLSAFGLPPVVNAVKADRLFLYPVLEALGLRGAWQAIHRYQALVLQAWRDLGTAIGAGDGPWTRPGGIAHEFASIKEAKDQKALLQEILRVQQWNRYGKAIQGVEGEDPSLQIIAAALEPWARADIPVLVVVIPINIELIDQLGIDDPVGRMRTVRALAGIARSVDARFLDLHTLLPEESFADWQGHYSLDPTPGAPSLIAESMVPVLASMVQEDR